jgi:hypothetical protein
VLKLRSRKTPPEGEQDPQLEAEIIETSGQEFEFEGFSVQHQDGTQDWWVECPDPQDEGNMVTFLLEEEGDPFSNEDELFLHERFGIIFKKEDLERLKEILI